MSSAAAADTYKVNVRGGWAVLLLVGVVSAITVEKAAARLDLHGIAHAGGRPAADVLVWLDLPGTEVVAEQNRVVLDQRNLTFTPRVLAVPVGTTVEFPNNDRVFHNVFSFRDGKRFDLGLYPVGSTRRVTFDKPGLSRIFCNIHPNMAAYVMAVDSPYFGVSDRSGAFRIPAVPTGTYTYYAWRPGADQLTGMWSSAAGRPLTVEWP
jgi:plastocyanin